MCSLSKIVFLDVVLKAKFWILRMLGWWHYEATRPPAESGAPPRLSPPPVFPATTVRPLVLRGHALSVGTKPEDVTRARRQLVRFVLLALALGRRAVLPLLPCDIPVPETPVAIRNHAAMLKLSDRAMCDGAARQASWSLPPNIAPEPSHERLRVTAEMAAMGDYSKVMKWPPPRAPSCCQLIPELRCVDKYGEHGELQDELMLCERDFGWLLHEAKGGEGASVAVARAESASPLTLDSLRSHSDARTLVIDLNGAAAGADALAMLPSEVEVEKTVRQALDQRGGDVAGGELRLPAGSHACVQRLFSLVE